MNNDYEITRQNVWLKAWCAVASSQSCEYYEIATDWADKCLEDFDKRFRLNFKGNIIKKEDLLEGG